MLELDSTGKSKSFNLKQNARLDFLGQIESLSVSDFKSRSDAINTHLNNILKFESGSWGAFLSLKTEPDIIWSNVSSSIDWFFVEIENEKLIFKNSSGQIKKVNQLDGIIIPALGFNTNGQRLGRGKGFYDRTLQDVIVKKIGVCFDLALSAEVPTESYDIKMNLIVTDQKILSIN